MKTLLIGSIAVSIMGLVAAIRIIDVFPFAGYFFVFANSYIGILTATKLSNSNKAK